MKRFSGVMFLILLFVAFTGCGGGGGETGGDRIEEKPVRTTAQIAGLYSANAKITMDLDGQVVQTSSEDFFVRIDQKGKNVSVNLYDKENVKAQYPTLPDPLVMQCTMNADSCKTMSITGTVPFQGVEIMAYVPSSILSVEQNGQLTWPLEITLTIPASESNDGKEHKIDIIREFLFDRHEMSTTPSGTGWDADISLPPAIASQGSLVSQSWIDSSYDGQGCYAPCTYLEDNCVVWDDYTQLCAGGPSGLDEYGDPVQY
jgi:hypothetical protein